MSLFSGKCDLYDHMNFERTYQFYTPGKLRPEYEEYMIDLYKKDHPSDAVQAQFRSCYEQLGEWDYIVPTTVIRQVVNKFAGTGKDYDPAIAYKIYNSFSSYTVSDEFECFRIFKARTGGVLHQQIQLQLTDFNIDVEIQKINNARRLSKIEHKEIVADKRVKSGQREKITYSYIYWGKEYSSLAQINKEGYYTIIDIPFETIFDLVPYYPYTTSFSSCDNCNKSEYVIISDESHVDIEQREHLKYGNTSSMNTWYHQTLQDHYAKLIQQYGDVCYKRANHTEEE